MTDFSLYERITRQGTLSEPKGAADSEFALPSSTNWMRALALLVEDQNLNFTTAGIFYGATAKKVWGIHEENTIFEQLLFAIHQVSALKAIATAPRKADVARIGIVTWYYGIYAAASAMVTAQAGSFQDDHIGTAATWDQQLASRGLIMHPFELRVSTLVKSTADTEIKALQAKGNEFKLIGSPPTNARDAYGACVSYLSGNVNWWRERNEELVKSSREFKNLNVTNFRTKAARDLRDKRLGKYSVAFHHEAFRYRGKANYRDAVYLGYGSNVEPILATYMDDLCTVLTGFVAMAGAFSSIRLGNTIWKEFLSNLTARRSFTLSPMSIWS